MTEAAQYPTPDEIRQALLTRADQLVELTGMTKSEIGAQAVNDTAFLGDLAAGRNITINVYGRVLDFLNAKIAEATKPRRKAARST